MTMIYEFYYFAYKVFKFRIAENIFYRKPLYKFIFSYIQALLSKHHKLFRQINKIAPANKARAIKYFIYYKPSSGNHKPSSRLADSGESEP